MGLSSMLQISPFPGHPPLLSDKGKDLTDQWRTPPSSTNCFPSSKQPLPSMPLALPSTRSRNQPYAPVFPTPLLPPASLHRDYLPRPVVPRRCRQHPHHSGG